MKKIENAIPTDNKLSLPNTMMNYLKGKNNMQLLDPIGALAKVAMLGISPPKTKLRITEHTLQLVQHSIQERIFYRPFVYQDSNENISGLYAAIIQFIETYLIDNHNHNHNPNYQENYNNHNHNFLEKQEETQKLRENIINIAECCRKGIVKLQETYHFNNAVFALQLFSNLLKAGCDGTYNASMIPPHLSNLTKNSSLDEEKMKQIWKPDFIITLGTSLKECYATGNQTLRNSYISGIETLLNDREIEFQKFILSITILTVDTPTRPKTNYNAANHHQHQHQQQEIQMEEESDM